MSTGLHYLDAGLVVAACVWIVWRMYSLSFKSRTERRQGASSKTIARQPWAEDKAGGRGNR
jgi:hypothetical protein